MQERAQEITTAALKAGPPVAVAGADAAGMSVNEMVMWATLIYVVLQIVVLLLREWRGWRKRRSGVGIDVL